MIMGRPGWLGACRTAAIWCGVLAGLAAGQFADAAGPRGKSEAAKAAAPIDEIDRLIREAWDEAGLKPTRRATEDEFLRRAYLDLLGRIPTIREAIDFLDAKEKDGPGKRAKLVELLLAHPDYAKNMANRWSVALIGRKRQDRQVKPDALAAWLRRQFAENRPWNEVALDLITAKGSNTENGAVNYPLAHMDGDAVVLTSLTSRLFLGQQIQCTQCHDHPSNDWKQADFWGINAFFKGMKANDVRLIDATGAEVIDHTELVDMPTDAYATYEKRNALVGVAFPTFLDGRKISQDADVDRREALGKFIADPANVDFAKAYVNRIWVQLLGRGFVNPVDDFGPHNPPSHPELLEVLAADFKASGFDTKALIRRVMASQAYNLSSVTPAANEKDEVLFSHMVLKPMEPEQLFESLLVATSAHKAGGADDEKSRRAWLDQFVFAFANDEEQEASSFQGTIPQALMMMNGDLMGKAVGGKPGSFLADLLEDAKLRRRGAVDAYVVNHLYLAALARYPAPRELARAREYLASSPDTIPILEDIFWALLNSNEFALNR